MSDQEKIDKLREALAQLMIEKRNSLTYIELPRNIDLEMAEYEEILEATKLPPLTTPPTPNT